MYHSFYSLPEIKHLQKKEQRKLYRQAHKKLGRENQRTFFIIFGMAVSFIIGRGLITMGISGELLAGLIILTYFSMQYCYHAWLLNRFLHPIVKELLKPSHN